MGQRSKTNRVYSRRDLLKMAPLAVAGGLVVGLVLGKPVVSRLFRGRKGPEFPEGSIFTPAKHTRHKT
jgi:hypothetical protein